MLNEERVLVPATSSIPTLPTAEPGVVAPPAVYSRAVAAGESKAKLSWAKTFVMGILAGAYIG